jgi:precorrin-6A/cobalt-precorrin-6A reductase
VLGGTTEARELAGRLDALPGVSVETSLAGGISGPLRPPVAGSVHVGPFRDAEELAAYLRDFDAVVDATHPFAQVISATAAAATVASAVPLLVLRRPGWAPRPDDDWRRVPTFAAAAAVVATLPAEVVFLAIGRREMSWFAGSDRQRFVLRMIEAPAADEALPARRDIVLARGPFELAGERALFTRHRIEALVTKDSGGDATAAKLVAARALGIPVVMIDRPPLPADVPVVDSVPRALAWLVSSSR